MADTDRTRDEADPDGTGNPAEHEAPEAEQLALADERERLPWLDADDDDDEDASTDGARMFGFVLIGMVALIALVGGIWWASHGASDPALVADGSTIQAPVQPYKETPKNPGGKTFDGTGDSAFAVSEGQTRSAKIGDAGASAVPASRPSLTSAKVPASSATPFAASSATTKGPVVQVGAYSTQATAETGWSKLAAQYSALAGLKHQIVEGQADIGTVYRLQVLPGEAGGAQALCSRLKAAGLACQVKG